MRRWWPEVRRISGVVFLLLFLAIPIALLASVRPWAFAAGLAGLGVVVLIGSVYLRAGVRRRAQNAAKGLLTAAAILAIVHFSNLLEPFYRREGWLLLNLDAKVVPLQVSPGDTLTYTLSTTNTGKRAARGRQFVVNGVPYTGLLMYGVLPDLDNTYFPIVGTATATVSSETEPQGLQERACTVVYANPHELGINPMYWSWSTTYAPGWKVVAVITSNGSTHRDLAVGETLELRYRVTIPPDHPEGPLHHKHASLSYRDPQWATYSVHDLWFPFNEVIAVLPATH